MDNVVPLHGKTLDEYVQHFENCYSVLHTLYVEADRLEAEIERFQEDYERALLSYSNSVGKENVEIKYLEYTINFDYFMEGLCTDEKSS